MADGTCSVPGCERKRGGRGLCDSHYVRLKNDGDVHADVPIRDYRTATCSVFNCGRKHYGRGLCQMHWSRARRTGDIYPAVAGRSYRPVGMTLAETFHHFMPGLPPETECWEWTGSLNGAGYGTIRMVDRKIPAHRVAYELFVGSIPDGLIICHHCDNPPCCNPRHLYPGTHVDNAHDMVMRGRNHVVSLPGSVNPAAKISAEDAASIRRIYAQGGVIQKDLAEMFGITQTTVSAIVRGKSWRSA
jgi:HNH endonuclease/helix-turn-helix protein